MPTNPLRTGDLWLQLIEEWLKRAEVFGEAERLAAKIPLLKKIADEKSVSLCEAARIKAGGDLVQQRLELGIAEGQGYRLPEWRYVRRIEEALREAREKTEECLEQAIHMLQCNLVRNPRYKDLILIFEGYRGRCASAKDVGRIIEVIEPLAVREPSHHPDNRRQIRGRIVDELQEKLGCSNREGLARELATNDSSIRAAARDAPTHSGPTAEKKILEACQEHGVDINQW